MSTIAAGDAASVLEASADDLGLARLQAARYREPPEAVTYLDARCQFALAKALLSVDQARAHLLAELAFRAVVNMAHDETSSGIPWALRSEQPLSFAFTQARDIGERARPHEEARLARIAAFEAERERRRQRSEEDRRQFEIETPSAEVMLAELQAGKQLDLNSHSLEWDEEMDMLAGDNAYGIEYFWGRMTLASVARWRATMLDGRMIGECPPGGGEDDGYDPHEEDVYGPHGPAYDLYEEHQSLQAMCEWVFTSDLQGLVPASPANS